MNIGRFINKRGQLTIFIIVAIIIVALAALFFIFKDELGLEEPYSPEVAPISNFVQECIESKGEEALYFIGQHGGYFFPPEPFTATGVPYYLTDDENLFPLKEKIENEISRYINEALPDCTGNFTEFKDFEITEREVKTNTSIFENRVILDVYYPLTITKGESVINIENFENTKIPVRLGVIYDASKFIIEQHIKTLGEICISCLLDLQEQEDIYITVNTEYNTLTYTITDTNSILDYQENILEPEPYGFKFAVKY